MLLHVSHPKAAADSGSWAAGYGCAGRGTTRRQVLLAQTERFFGRHILLASLCCMVGMPLLLLAAVSGVTICAVVPLAAVLGF